MGFGTGPKKVMPRVPLRHGERNKDHLTSFGGLAALSLEALSSVAYGPEAIALVLVVAATSALRLTPVALARAGNTSAAALRASTNRRSARRRAST
jgi:hypothetical protein